MEEGMKGYRVVVEVTLQPGTVAEAVLYVDAHGEAGAKVAALETMAYRLAVKSVEVSS